MSYFVFREGVDPSKKHAKRLKDGTIIRGGYEVAYMKSAEGLQWAKQCARRVGGVIYVKNIANEWSKIFTARKKHNNQNIRRAA